MDRNTSLGNVSQHLIEPSSLSRKTSCGEQITQHKIDTPLSNLSPSSTLEALIAVNAVPSDNAQCQSFIQNSVASASASERAWGVKAALAGKKLREWHEELSGWVWPGYDWNATSSPLEEQQGALSVRTAQQYEERIDTVQDDMETLEVDDLKNYVRNTHFGSHPGNPSSPAALKNYDHLDDFTTLITAIIVQALPTLARLNLLLSIWSLRLVIVRQVPQFLKDLADGQESMSSAWVAVGGPNVSLANRKPEFLRQSFVAIQAVLRDQISELGRKLDAMLDLMEGSQDTLPEQWIDDLDGLENEYSLWVVEAEELALQNEIDPTSDEHQAIRTDADSATNENTMSAMKLPADAYANNAQNQLLPKRDDLDFDEEQPSYPVSKNSVDHSVINNTDSSVTNNQSMTSALRSGSDISPKDSSQNGPTAAEMMTHVNRSSSSRRPPPLKLDDQVSSIESTPPSDMGSESSDHGSAISDYFSDKSSPELRNASVVEFVGTPGLVASPWSSREAVSTFGIPSQRPSLENKRSSRPSQIDSLLPAPNQRGWASAYAPEENVNFSSKFESISSDERSFIKQHARTRSVSTQFFEPVPKNEIRKIMIPRSGSCTEGPSVSRLPEPASEREIEPEAITVDPQEDNTQSLSNTTPVVSDESKEDQPYQAPSTPLEGRLHASAFPTSPNKSLVPPKSPHRFQQVSELGPGSAPVKIRRNQVGSGHCEGPGAMPVTPIKALSRDAGDRLEARISSILTEIPAHIRLTTGPEPDAPEVHRFNPVSRIPASRPLAVRAQTSLTPPTMTLAPVQLHSSKAKAQNGESDIKLYHLHQSGKDVPIKLFVRLVGEGGERVMVRIGGGWADLAEYLKEYASHHGRRSVSDTRFDIQGIPSSPLSQPSPSTPGSISSRPNPAIIFKRQHTTPGKYESPQQYTPGSDRPASRLSWAGTDEESSPSLGLAGPKTRNVEISPRRQAWVDEMVEQARGNGGGGNGGLDIGEMGKVGGVKRVFLKGRNRAGSGV